MRLFVVLPLLSLLLFSGSPKPELSIIEEYDFGDLTLNEPETVKIPFENTGDAPLRVSCSVNCKCLTITWPEETVMPGKSDTITITFDAAKTGTLKKTVYILTNEIDRYDGIGQAIYKRYPLYINGYVNEP